MNDAPADQVLVDDLLDPLGRKAPVPGVAGFDDERRREVAGVEVVGLRDQVIVVGQLTAA
jgi:hypothetical protein